MKAQNTLFAALLFLCLSTGLGARTLSIGNADFRSDVVFSGHRIADVTFVESGGVQLSRNGAAPVFEFCLNGEILRSSDPVWNYVGLTRQELSNGGVIVSYAFRGRARWKGLEVVWDREFFPTGVFVRERLRMRDLRARDGFRLTNCEGRNRLVFPRYAFASDGPVHAKEQRIADFREKRAFPEHHMFHPDSSLFDLGAVPQPVKGPFLILTAPDRKYVTSYEHASQDRVTWQSEKKPAANNAAAGASAGGNDASQGVEGEALALSDDDLWFIATEASLSDGTLLLSNYIRHGGYLDGEPLPSDGWYETVWSTLTILPRDADHNKAIGEYLYSRITDNAESRVADFYYNTWGMQRQSKTLYPVMNEERLKREMRLAAECGVTTFVLDDGWQEQFGHWTCNYDRIPCGLGTLAAYIDSLGMRPGVWLSLPGAAEDDSLVRAHPEWLIKDSAGKPIRAQWKHPVYDLVGPYYDCLLDQLKALTDEGIRFFKWDAMNLFSSTLPGLWHGDESYSARERADRYNYLLPFYVTKLMRELREYCPGVVVELDMTEPERCMMGLMVLQEGKYYFINNGASKYEDYSSYRTKSMRTVINKYASFVPQEVFTYAFYPHHGGPFFCGRYNITSALTAGHGIWGNLELTTPVIRSVAKDLFGKASLVLPHVAGNLVECYGEVGATPEIYVQRDSLSGYALLTAFSDEWVSERFVIGVDPSAVVGVLGYPFVLGPEGVELQLGLTTPPSDCISAFVIGGKGSGPQVYSCRGCLQALESDGGSLRVTAQSNCTVTVALSDGRLVTASIPAGETVAF